MGFPSTKTQGGLQSNLKARVNRDVDLLSFVTETFHFSQAGVVPKRMPDQGRDEMAAVFFVLGIMSLTVAASRRDGYEFGGFWAKRPIPAKYGRFVFAAGG